MKSKATTRDKESMKIYRKAILPRPGHLLAEAINPKLNLPWTDIAGRKRGFWQAGPDLKTALLELLRGGGDS